MHLRNHWTSIEHIGLKMLTFYWSEATLSKTFKEQRSIKLREDCNTSGNKTNDKFF